MPTGFNNSTDAFGEGVQATSVPGGDMAPVPTPSDMATQAGGRRLGRRQAGRTYDGGSSKGNASEAGGDASRVVRSDLYEQDRASHRRKKAIVALALLVLAVVSLCIDFSTHGIISPLEVVACYGTWFQNNIGVLFGWSQELTPQQIMALHPTYFRTINQVGVTLVTIASGVLLALAGALYQSVFRNPIASPSMLGVSSGANLGTLLLVLIFGVMSSEHLVEHYALSYLAVGVTMALLILFTKLMSGKGRPLNVVNMLLVGTILNQLIGAVINFCSWYVLDESMWEIYNSLNEVYVVDTSPVSIISTVLAFFVAVIPIYMVRFRLNVLSFTDQDMQMLGVSGTRLRIVALVCGTVMMLTAQIHSGSVAMIALVVPHISRFVFGAEFSKQFSGNLLIGASLLVLCHCIIYLIPFDFALMLNVGTVVNFVVLPAFVWMIATQQRSWD